MPGAVLGLGDSAKVPDLVVEEDREEARHNKEANYILNCILGQRAVSLRGKKK